MDDAGLERAAVAGNSLGGYLALHLAARGRASSVVALAPAGGWPPGDPSFVEALGFFRTMQELVVAAAPHAEALLASPEGRRRATEFSVTNFEHIPAELLAHQLRGVAGCEAVYDLIDHAEREGFDLDAEAITCPVRIVWGTADRILPWPIAAERYRTEWLPSADWVELDGIGHMPQLDVPLETAQLILDFTRSQSDSSRASSSARELTRVDRLGGADQGDLELRADVDLELAAVEDHRDRALGAAQVGGDGGAGCARTRRERLPHPALEDPGPDPGGALPAPEADVGPVREDRRGFDRRSDRGEIEVLEAVDHLDRALRVADRDVLELVPPAPHVDRPEPVLGPSPVVPRDGRGARPSRRSALSGPRSWGRTSPAAVRIANSSRSVQPARRR